ncbi:MAG TPA: tripartite tricarboxylate transporter substrate binding protein [Pseudonocardia sp.]|uniref:Bug family tripartite tricarboxylate transporter substrate binding protein n=1 Tax=Pseudonocardia sp. TaxID=60912 RepID=UPI002B4B435C|nr:tripartite tricarboxylate transporter substrate binding protein [Pseudonocardia sp.]HLU60047.1 tripartite tricarboxylate transporter substrate binding protein [Pseudonocardia sp.]
MGGPETTEQGDPRRPGRGVAALAVALAATVAIVLTAPADDRGAAQEVLGERQLRIMAPASPGGGWDQTSREMQKALRELVGRTEVYNVSGAGGTIGLSQFVRHEGDPAELMTTGLIMMGAVIANGSPHSLADTTPLVRLTTDYQVIVVAADSPITGVADLVAAMQADVGAVSISGGSAGGAEQIMAGLLAQAVGADPAQVSYVVHSGGGEALTTVLSGRSTIGIFGLSEIAPQIEAGTVRAIAVSSAERLPSLPDVPSLAESGLDVVVENWRGVVAPPGISDEEERALEDVLVRMAHTEAWRDALARRGWGDALLAGEEFEAFVRSEQERVSRVLTQIGLGGS